MAPTSHNSGKPNSPRLRRRRHRHWSIVGAEGCQRRLADRMRRCRWYQSEARLVGAEHHRLVIADAELVGSTGMAAAAITSRLSGPGVKTMSAKRLLEGIRPDPDGSWLVKSGLFFDPRLRGTEPDRRLAEQAGPRVAAMACRRRGLEGYLAAVLLAGQPQMAAAVSPRAYLQQVQAAAVDEPVLAAHLRYGARPVAIVPQSTPPVVLVRWRR